MTTSAPLWWPNVENPTADVPSDEPALLAAWYGHTACRNLLAVAEQHEAYEECAMWQRALACKVPYVENAEIPVPDAAPESLKSDMHTKAHFLQALRNVVVEWQKERDDEFEFTVDDPTRGHPDAFLAFTATPYTTRQPVLTYLGQFKT